MLKYIHIAIILILLSKQGYSQNKDYKKIVTLKGKIESLETLKAVAFAHIIDINNRSVTVSDTLGIFSLTVLKGDTLRISSIGFEPYLLSLADSVVEGDDFYVKIEMLTRSYNLSEIDVYRMRWAEFEFEFMNASVVSNETGEKIKQLVFNKELAEDLQHLKLSQSFGVLLAFDMPSWKSRSRNKVNQMEEEDNLQKLIDAKYNEELVSKITGLNGQALKSFINFCKLDPIYIINSTDYEIVSRVKSLYKSYRQGIR